MEAEQKQKLINLGTDVLADALLNLAVHSEEADALIKRLTATPKENAQRFKRKLSGLKRRKRFIDWRKTRMFARELEMLLLDLKAGVSDPLSGLELVASFYETDSKIFETCDDSDGNIGDIFRVHAKELFLEYASRCSHKENVANIILRVNQRDDYGVRSELIDIASEYLPESIIRTMITTIQKRADEEKNEYAKRHHLRAIESLARQIKDAKLFEKAYIDSWGQLSSAALIEIAQIHLKSDDVERAHAWLKKIPEGERYMKDERDALLLEVYKMQGCKEKQSDLLYEKFRSHPSKQTLEALLDVIGHNWYDEVVSSEVSQIMKQREFDYTLVIFLLDNKKIDEAESYLLERADQINGEHYNSFLSLVKAMEAEEKWLAASLIYRKLLSSILERGYIKAYPYGVRYLKKLDTLSEMIPHWSSFPDHETFKDNIHKTHARKSSFWSKYLK